MVHHAKDRLVEVNADVVKLTKLAIIHAKRGAGAVQIQRAVPHPGDIGHPTLKRKATHPAGPNWDTSPINKGGVAIGAVYFIHQNRLADARADQLNVLVDNQSICPDGSPRRNLHRVARQCNCTGGLDISQSAINRIDDGGLDPYKTSENQNQRENKTPTNRGSRNQSAAGGWPGGHLKQHKNNFELLIYNKGTSNTCAMPESGQSLY